ncbi:4-hydroxy-tetrahydrodipicolinate synthase [Cellulophaga sp. HaHaR_3_176]|uniref:4-hydroxy-tetrahydrodipicolinate synthase n=1 Tax=Cellulophaga sp. HaHaR_3_176 TaxID=1942464 RepID=UPI001C1F349F|nr:4-hydroxy-tetrahydrodipicolinate synthase [Cellulophaga sp. HaHaR_3_176]QWX82551.1 4-hydroxy-tetrahydrodipicolinate synthase [Cellulophaga sp. HaHaR_3_176]
MEHLYGTGVALVTPFNDDFSVDVAGLQRVVEHSITGGVDYLVVLGTTAETATLTQAEKELVVKTIIQTNAGRLSLVLGVGGNNTALVVEELKTIDLSEFAAILSVSPYYNKPTQEGIYQHFKAISIASPKPIIIYNVPGRTGSNMQASTTIRLAQDFKNIVAIKEACGDMNQIGEILKEKPEDFLLISGDDITALPTVLAGGAGVISVIGQGLPAEFSRMIRLGMQKEIGEAYEIHHSLEEGMNLIFEEGNPAGIKAIFEILTISKAIVRLPLMEATPSLKSKINHFVTALNEVSA